MKIKKVLQTSFDLTDPNEIYTTDIESVLSAKILKRYLYRCYQSMLITGLSRIIRYSDIHMNDTRLDGAAYIDVQFEADGIILMPGEVVPACKIVSITNNGVIIENEHLGGILQSDPKKQLVKILKKDQVIPVIIQAARYNPYQNQITVKAIPYYPIKSNIAWFSINDEPMTPIDTEKISLLLEEYNQLLKKPKLTQYNHFDNLTAEESLKFDIVPDDLKTLLAIKHKSICCSGLNTYIRPSNKEDYPSSLYSALSYIYNKKIARLNMLHGLSEAYPDTATNQAYWKLFKMLTLE